MKTKETIHIGDVTIGPGSKGHGVLAVPDALPDGSSVEVPFVVINGAKAGPTLHLQAGSHSFETQGLGAISEAFAEVDPEELSGTLSFALPNPLGVRQRLHYYVDWNVQPAMGFLRAYNANNRWPGEFKGSYFDMALNLVWENMIKGRANCVIDFHSRGSWGEGPPWISCAAKLAEDLAISFGTEIIMTGGLLDEPVMKLDYPKFTRTIGERIATLCRIDEQCIMNGIPAFETEGTAGSGGYELRGEVNATEVRGIKNVMKKLGMIEGKMELPRKQYIFPHEPGQISGTVQPVIATKGGFFVSRVKFKQTVKNGEILGGIYSMRTLEEIEPLTAPTDGMVFYLPEYPLIKAGETPIGVLDYSKAQRVIENP